MMTINLDKDFQPYGDGIEFNDFVFPSSCEVHVKLSEVKDTEALITTRIKSSDDVMKLLMATDALRRSGVKNILLLMPYLPYARQDRQMVSGEPLSLKVFSDLINSQSYSKVFIYDVHSDVAPALINNCHAISNHSFVEQVLKDDADFLIVSPDAGAYKKIFKVCQHIKYKGEIIMCNKIRDVTNGTIRSLTISHDDLDGKNCYIIDDICDGGGTFVLLADELKKRNAGKVYLIVSHGILSKGIEPLISGISHTYCTNSFSDLHFKKEYSKYITQINLTKQLLYE